MELFLKRMSMRADGIFSELRDDQGRLIAITAEHAYLQEGGLYAPKIPDGTYTCVRGNHRLHNMPIDFTTFEITGVKDHTNLLFHWGNWPQVDSDGCVLTGRERVETSKGPMVTLSRETFAEFMERLDGIDSIPLTVYS